MASAPKSRDRTAFAKAGLRAAPGPLSFERIHRAGSHPPFPKLPVSTDILRP